METGLKGLSRKDEKELLNLFSEISLEEYKNYEALKIYWGNLYIRFSYDEFSEESDDNHYIAAYQIYIDIEYGEISDEELVGEIILIIENNNIKINIIIEYFTSYHDIEYDIGRSPRVVRYDISNADIKDEKNIDIHKQNLTYKIREIFDNNILIDRYLLILKDIDIKTTYNLNIIYNFEYIDELELRPGGEYYENIKRRTLIGKK